MRPYMHLKNNTACIYYVLLSAYLTSFQSARIGTQDVDNIMFNESRYFGMNYSGIASVLSMLLYYAYNVSELH